MLIQADFFLIPQQLWRQASLKQIYMEGLPDAMCYDSNQLRLAVSLKFPIRLLR